MLWLASVVAVYAICVNIASLPYHVSAVVAVMLYLLTVGWKRINVLLKTFTRDVEFVSWMFTLICKILSFVLRKRSHSHPMYDNVRKHPHKLAFVDADTKKSLTFKEVQEMVHKIANVFHEAGYRKGDCVALVMENCIEYNPIWFGLSMMGIVTSLVNNNLRGESLKHCLKVCDCKAVVFSQQLSEAFQEIQSDISIDMYCLHGGQETSESWKVLGSLLDTASSASPPTCPEVKLTDTLLYIYTSGTTGLPKAVRINRMKLLSYMGIGLSMLKPDDTMYESMPLYHGNGLMCALTCFSVGGTTIIKKKFSASRFIEDCCKYNVTVINYIGEICRYVLAQPSSVFDHIVTLRLAIGNGLKPSIWHEFKNRFNIKRIVEFYGATEANLFLINVAGRAGAVGYELIWFPWFSLTSHMKLIKTNPETGEIVRNSQGLAIEAGIDEPGQPVGKISKLRKFDGYTNAEATAKKIGRNIFSVGDSAFLSGDMLTKDAEGYYYFNDRFGDTFRWKGENVSTNEVEGLISKVLEMTDVCVYGVEVPGNEGKAGMAYIMDPQKTTNVENLPKELDEILPKYAQPLFLRLSREAVEMTGTFKFQKNKLRTEGYDPRACGDEDLLYYFDKRDVKYKLITVQIYDAILDKSVTF